MWIMENRGKYGITEYFQISEGVPNIQDQYIDNLSDCDSDTVDNVIYMDPINESLPSIQCVDI